MTKLLKTAKNKIFLKAFQRYITYRGYPVGNNASEKIVEPHLLKY